MMVTYPMSPQSQDQQQHRFRVALSFALVYVLWGSTYLAMRIAVRDLPPFVIGATRYLISGPLMLAACAMAGRKIRLTRSDFWRLLAIGMCLLSIGNMGVLWGEKYVSSGLAALVVAVVPIWVVAIEAWIYRAGRMSAKGLFGLATGMGGLLVLMWPRLTAGTHLGRLELIGCGILSVGAVAWALGSVFSHRFELSVDVFVAAAWQMTLGGSINLLIGLATGQFHQGRWTASVMLSIAYLIVCGSWIGFTAYIWLLEHVPTPKVATYAYVNPIVAVFLGWLLLNERVDGFMLVGTVIIIGSVALVNTSKLKRQVPGPAEDMEPQPVNAGAD
jgi:drug/metabolite transporter (DMT)-like permease